MKPEIPKSVKLGNEELDEELEEAAMESGSIGDAAKAVHGGRIRITSTWIAIPKLPRGLIAAEMKDTIPMTERLIAERLTPHAQTEEESLSGSHPCGKIPGDETIRKQ